MVLVLDDLPLAQGSAHRPLTAGERWTEQALADLRRRRYRPRAWWAFLRSSLQRSRAAREEVPERARQARAWGVGGALAWTAACGLARGRGASRPALASGLAWWLAVWQMLDWHLGMADRGDGPTRGRLSPADAVTMVRFWLVPALPPAARAGAALPIVIALGGVTDALDGILARRYGRTRLGRDLDTTADLAFFATAAVVARRAGRLDRLAGWSLATRYGAGVTFSLAAVFGRARRPGIQARRWGGLLRVSGLAVGTTDDLRRLGTALLVAGCAVPPRATVARVRDWLAAQPRAGSGKKARTDVPAGAGLWTSGRARSTT
jgi:phosphatidylglycerophosphate synthase